MNHPGRFTSSLAHDVLDKQMTDQIAHRLFNKARRLLEFELGLETMLDLGTDSSVGRQLREETC